MTQKNRVLPVSATCNNMVMEENEIPSGWPLGLGNMNLRLRTAETSPNATTTQSNVVSRPIRSSSFSSFSSSNLDTESTASFFPDRSVSLGRLIGIQPRKKGSSNCLNLGQNNICVTRCDNGDDELLQGEDINYPQGLCVPLLHNVIEKMALVRSRSSIRG